MKSTIDLVSDLETNLSKLLLQIETLHNIHIELSFIRNRCDQERMNDQIVNYFVDERTKIRIIDDLLFYTVKDLENHYEIMMSQVEKLMTFLSQMQQK